MQIIYWAQKMNAGKFKHFAAETCTLTHNYHIQWHNSHHLMFLLFFVFGGFLPPQFCKTFVSNIF